MNIYYVRNDASFIKNLKCNLVPKKPKKHIDYDTKILETVTTYARQ